MKFSLSLFFFVLFLSVSNLKAQNVIINPSSDGGFEGVHGWNIVNHPSGENKWFIGNAEKSSGEFGAYVSDNTITQSLTTPQSVNAVIYLYKDVVVPANASSISMSFKFKNESVSDKPPRVFFAKTSLFEPTPRTNVIYSDYTTITKVLNNEQNWEPYTNTDPLVNDRQVTFSSRNLEPGESYRIMFEWSALQQGSITQTSPPTIYPTNPRIVTSSETYTPGTTTTVNLVFDQDGQNYDIVWSVEGGSEIQSGQGTTTMVVYHPLGVSGTQTYSARLLPNPRTPTFESNGVNSGLIAIDEVSLTFTGVPKINNLSANTAQVGANVVINGEYFDPIPANNIVYLGGMKCEVVSGDANSLTVTVPSYVGTAFFTVTNANTKLSAVSPIKFTPINIALANAVYASHSYSNLTFENPISFSTSFSSSYDQKFALMDLDIDGKLDVVSFASNGQPNFLKNTAVAGKLDASTFAAVSTFTGVSPTYTPNSSRSILFADFNNDGKLDIGASNNINDGGFINPNTSTIGTGSLGNSESIMASGNNYKVNAAFLPFDINRDGRLDIFGVSTEQGTVRPYYTQNTSTAGNFGFETIESERSFDLSSAYGGDFGDFDGDGAHDAVYGADGYVLLFKNNTQQGNPFVSNFSMQRLALLPLPNMFGMDKAYTVMFFDVDGDGNLDIVATNATRPILHIWRNSGSDFDVEPRQDFKIKDLRNTVGLTLGDLNGDGRLDIVTSDYVNGSGSKFSYLENQSTNGAVSFGESVTIIQSDDSYQQVEIADVDGDGKVDIIGANVSNGSLDVFRNRVFESGSIAENQEICIGTTTQEIASLAPGQVISGDIVYSWQSSTTDEISGFSTIANETAATLEPGNLTQTTYFRRGIASSDDPSSVFYTAPVEIKIVPLPTITEAVDVTICGTGSVPLVATTSAGETSFVNWYDAPTGGNLLGQSVSGEVFNTPEITQNTTFYAEAENANGCIAAAREAVEAILNLAIPTATLGTFEDTKCDAASFTLTASTSSEAVIKWYDAETEGNLLREGPSFTTPVISANTTYWVEASNCNGASTRTAIPLTLIQTPSIVAAPSLTTCQFSDVVLTAEASAGGVLNWYENPIGGVPNAAYATINNLSATTTRYVSASITVNGVTCESPRTPVKVTMLAGPTIGSGNNRQVYGANTVNLSVSSISPTDAPVNWYADAAGTQLLLSNSTTYTTPEIRQTTTYYAIAISLETGCQSAPRAITVNYSGPLYDALANTFALTDQENVVVKATGLSRLSTSTDYLWQRSDNGGVSWTNLSASTDAGITYSGFSGRGGTSAALTISKADAKLHGFQYRLKLYGTRNSDFVYTNPSTLTVADVYGACDEGDIPISNVTYTAPKTGLTLSGGVVFTSDKTQLTDGNLQTGLVVTNSESFPVTSALSFDGNDDNVFIGQPASIQATTSGITVEAWVYPRSFDNDWFKNPVVEKDGQFGLRIGSKVEQVFNQYANWDNNCRCYLGGYEDVAVGGSVAFTVANGTKNDSFISDGETIPKNQWSHIAGTYDASTGKIIVYVNGVKIGEKTNNQGFTTLGTGGNLILGGSPSSSRRFEGNMDEVRIWNYVKPQSEIQSSMSADVTESSGLVGYYKFMEGVGTTLSDLSGNGADGILNNFSFSGNSNWSTSSDITDTKKVASIVADLGATVTVNGVRLSNFNGLLDGGAPVQPNFTGGYLESSTDGVNWTRQINAIPSLPLNGQTLAINDVTARYFRFRKEDQTDGAYYGLSEITFLGGGYETVPYIREALPVEKYILSGTTLDLASEAMPISGETIASYQWSTSTSPLDGTFTDLTDGGDISGTNTSNLIISNYTNGTPTYYRLTATQSNGCVVSTQVLVNLETTPYYSTSSGTNTLNQLDSWTVNEDGSAGSAPVAFAENKFFILKNSGDGTYQLAADWTNQGTLKLNGNSLSLNNTYSATVNNIEDFSNSAYVKMLGTGYLKSNVSNEPKVFPVGTSTNYSPVTITNNLGADEVFSVSVADGVTNPGSGVQDYLAKTWKIKKTTSTMSGGTNIDITFEWNPDDVTGTLHEPMVFYGSSATTSSWSTITSSNYSSIERGENSITIKGFKSILTYSDRYFIIKNAAPTITAFTPKSAGSDMEVVITGTGFTGATAVAFGGTAATSFTVDSSTQITATVGAGESGNVTVTTPGGTVNKSNFSYKSAPTIISFTPTKTQVGQPIVITGTNFNNVAEVKIGGVVAAFKRNSSTQVTAVVPDGESPGSVEVTAEGGTATKTGFELGMPLAKAESIVSWYPANASTLDEPYTQSTRKEGAILSGEFTYSGLTGRFSSDRLKFGLPTVVGSTLNTATAPYISLKINTESLIDLERIVLQGYHASHQTKLQLRWSIDDFASSLGEFQGKTFNSTSSNYETKTNSNNWRYTSLSLASAEPIAGNEEIELRIYVYGNYSTSGHFCVVNNNPDYLSNDSSPVEFKDTNDAITVIGTTKNDPGLATVLPIEAMLSDRLMSFNSPVSNSSGEITMSIPEESNVAAYNNNYINFLGIGRDTLTIKQAETPDYMPATQLVPITVKDYPVVEFNSLTAFVDDDPLTLSVNSPSQGSVTYQSSDPNVATISGNTLSIVGKGVAQITAQQAAAGAYLAASANAVLLVKDPVKPTPTVTWINTVTKSLDDLSFTLEKPQSNSSGLFTYYSSNPQVATVSGREVSLVGNGITVLTAVQEETSSFNATKVITLLVVADNYKTAAGLTGLINYTKVVTDADFDVDAPTSSSTAPIIYVLADDEIASISGNRITLKRDGVTKLYAYQQETGTHKAAAVASTLTVNLPEAPSISYSDALNLPIGIAITPISSASSAGTVTSYEVWPPLPAGLSLNQQTGEITGTPTTLSAETNYQISGRNLGGVSNADFSLSVIDLLPSNLSYSTPQVFTKGQTITPLSPSVSGGAVVSYSVTPALPLGLSLNTITGEISGAPLFISAQETFTIKAENTGGGTTFDLQITVEDSVPTSLSYPAPVVLSKGVEMVEVLPFQNSGGEIAAFTVQGTPLPAGLMLNAQTGAISGTPTVIVGSTSYTIRGSNSAGFVDGTIQLIINDAPPIISYSDPVTVTKGVLMTPLLPTNTGGETTRFSLATALPQGLSFNTSTGEISGTPTVLSPAATYTITAENLFGTSDYDLTLAVVDVAPSNFTYPQNSIIATKNGVINSMTPTASGGAIVSYTISPELPAGILFNTLTGEVSGTPTVLSENTTYTVTATNTGGSTSTTFTIVVNDTPPSSLTYASFNDLTRGFSFNSGTPTANGGPIVSFAISPSLPAGLTLDAVTGLISGTPQVTTGTLTYTITATNSGGNTTATVAFAVNKAPLTISVNNASKVYGEADPANTVSYDGFVLGEDENDLSGALVFQREPGEVVGSYEISASGLTSSTEYDITYETGNLSITKLPVTVSVAAKNKNYGDADPSLTFEAVPAVGSTLANGEMVSFTGAIAREVGEDVGVYAITQNTLNNSNYTLSFNGADFTINALPVVVSAQAKSKVFGSLNPDLTFTAVPALGSSLPNGETVAFTGALSRTTGEDVGTYVIDRNTLSNSNYAITYNAADFTITKLPVTVTAQSKTKVYGEQDPILTYMSIPEVGQTLPNGDLVSFEGDLSREEGEDAGVYAITQNTLNNSNYLIAYTSADFEITKRNLVVTANRKERVYGESNPTFTFTYNGLANGDIKMSTEPTISSTATQFSNVGTYPISLTGGADSNYEFVLQSDLLIVLPKLLTITADAKTKEFGEDDPELTVSYTGFVNGEDAEDLTGTLAISRVAGEAAGTYAITASGLTSTNYSITYAPGEFTINSKSIAVTDITISPISDVVYSGLAQTPSPEVKDGATTLVEDTDYELSYTANTNVGTATITITGINAYEGSRTVTFNITRALLTITADAKTKEFGEDDPE
ncbi:MBG domain-containing protein, partial [Polaribacter marinaquae]|uniref:MBG domain-containing protein n=1 Tax=Polaribacter marinaquae TaxID=1642819 RepID=UPI00363F9F65